MPAVAELLAEQDIVPGEIDRVVCGAGPGSFTSLRIAGAIAKGIALAAVCPLVPISSLALLVASREPVEAGRYLAVLDALRGEHYVGLFEVTDAGETRALGPGASDPDGRDRRARGAGARARGRFGGACGATLTTPRAGAVARLDVDARGVAGGRSGDVGAGVRPPGGSAGEVGGGARARAGGDVTAIAGALHIRPAVDADVAAMVAIERASFSDPWTAAAIASTLRSRPHARPGRRGAWGTRRGWRGRSAGVCCGHDRRTGGGDRRPRGVSRRSPPRNRSRVDRSSAGRPCGGWASSRCFSRCANRTTLPARSTSLARSRGSAGGGGTTGSRWRMRSCSSGSWVRPEVKCHVK